MRVAAVLFLRDWLKEKSDAQDSCHRKLSCKSVITGVKLSRMSRHKVLSLAACLLFIASLLSAQSIWKEPKNPSWKTATGAEQYERLLWQAIQKKDWLAVESHIASNFVYSDSAGTKDKSQRLAELKQMAVPDVDLKEANVTANGIDAVVTYTLAGTRYLSVWQQQKSGWVLIAMSRSK